MKSILILVVVTVALVLFTLGFFVFAAPALWSQGSSEAFKWLVSLSVIFIGSTLFSLYTLLHAIDQLRKRP